MRVVGRECEGAVVSALRLAFVTTEDSPTLESWSGIPFHMARTLVRQGVTLERMGPLPTPIFPHVLARGRQLLYRSRRRWYFGDRLYSGSSNYLAIRHSGFFCRFALSRRFCSFCHRFACYFGLCRHNNISPRA